MELKNNYSLKSLNTFHVDASAKLFVEAFFPEDIMEAVQYAKNANEKFLVLGGGSNILFTSDFDGLVIKNSIPGIEYVDEGDSVMVTAGAGVIWDDLVDSSVMSGFHGIENLSLIPGTVGAAPIQNIGAYGAELKDCFHSLKGIFIETLEEKTFNSEDCEFGYRDSIFKRELKNQFIITKVTLRLLKEADFNVAYASLKKAVQNVSNKELNLKLIRESVINIRRSKLPDPDKLGNAGSFFKNPVVSVKKYDNLKEKYPDIPANVSGGDYKLYAGWLIEQAGYRGKRSGDVEAYNKQALVLVNRGSATGSMVKKFADEIVNAVSDKFGIELKSEVNII
jgi:UDP-N-acetylmuramate dehydrogenase